MKTPNIYDDDDDYNIKKIQKVLRKRKNLLSKTHRMKNHRFLGRGLQGIVYGNKKYVVKLTASYAEAWFAKKLIGKNYKHLVKIYKVQQVKGERIWAIKMERLVPVPEKILNKYSMNELFRHPHIVKAADTLAKMGYSHGDDHDGNIMYDPKKKVCKFIDFGFIDETY